LTDSLALGGHATPAAYRAPAARGEGPVVVAAELRERGMSPRSAAKLDELLETAAAFFGRVCGDGQRELASFEAERKNRVDDILVEKHRATSRAFRRRVHSAGLADAACHGLRRVGCGTARASFWALPLGGPLWAPTLWGPHFSPAHEVLDRVDPTRAPTMETNCRRVSSRAMRDGIRRSFRRSVGFERPAGEPYPCTLSSFKTKKAL
jgi:hypothetical protein